MGIRECDLSTCDKIWIWEKVKLDKSSVEVTQMGPCGWKDAVTAMPYFEMSTGTN